MNDYVRETGFKPETDPTADEEVAEILSAAAVGVVAAIEDDEAEVVTAFDVEGQPASNLVLLVDEDDNVLNILRRDVPWGIELEDGQRIVDHPEFEDDEDLDDDEG